MKTRLIKSFILICILCSLATAVQAKTGDLSLGETEYAKGNFKKALSYFDNVLRQQSDNATALYYRANTLIKLGLKTQALLDYQQAYRLSTSSTMRNYCQEAMLSLATNTHLAALNVNPPASAANDPNQQVQLNQSLGTIQLQSALDKVRIVDTGELFAQDFAMKQQLKLAEMQRETERNMQQMRDAFYYDRWGVKQPMYSAIEVQRYEEQRQQQQQDLMQSIQKSSQSQTQSAQRRAELDQESAANLESQLSGKGLPDGIKLDPLGTNLYVRNYDVTNSTESLPKPPVELMAKEKKLKQ